MRKAIIISLNQRSDFYCPCHCSGAPVLISLFRTSQMSLCFSISLKWLNLEGEELEWPFEKASASCYIPNTGVLYAPSMLMGGCWREVSWCIRHLISDLTASMASGWMSRKPRSQKAAGPALDWKKKHPTKHTLACMICLDNASSQFSVIPHEHDW